jgi:hypothetical protein
MFSRAEMWFRIAMAVETPAHAQRFCLIHLLHAVHASVATHAGDAPSDMGRVIEMSVVGQVVNLLPLNRLPGRLTLSNGEQLGTVRVDRGRRDRAIRIRGAVAVRAGRRRRNRRMGCLVHAAVAIPTVHLQLTRVQFMTEWDGLSGGVADVNSPR